MPHPQPRMSPQLAVGARAAPVLNQEHPQPLLRPGQVRLRVERSQFGIGSHPGVEPGDQKPKRLRAADGVIEADSRLFAHGPHPASRRPRTSYSRRQVQAGAVREEGQRIDRKLDRARHRPGAVPHVDLAAQQHRPLAGGGVLQRRAHLAGVQRVDPGVGVEHGEQHRRIVGAVDDVVVRRVAQQPTELGRVGCAAVLVAPGLAEPEALVAHHVEQGRRADHGGEQLRSLGQRGADQQAAVAAAGEAQLGWCSPALCDQPLGRAGEVGEHVALVLPHPGAAEWLVAQGWTTPAQLSLSGGSNGGLLVGAALTQRPELFAAVVCSAPLLDMVRYERFGLGQTWSDEYGSAADPTELGWLLSYSPYHHVVDGTDYPAVLFTVFDADTRVDPLHARKMCAALQHATASERPVLLRREVNVGHGARSVSRTIELSVDTLAFLAAGTGLDLAP